MSTTRDDWAGRPAGPPLRGSGRPAGLRVGRYRLLAKIGEGGMGVVHLAQDPDGQRVALKVLRPHVIGDDEARARLAQEVSSLRRVRSPRVAEIVDADPWGDIPYVATRYVPGLSLHDQVRDEGPIRGADLRWFAAGLAEAITAVHHVGVLHRDVKPSNVLLEGRSPVLIDFGLARLAEDPRLTMTGWLLGTPGYLAPEVLYGEDATTASDVHAWAATVAFAATGRPPFGRGPAMAIMDRVRRGEHDLTGVPADLVPLLVDCLAAEPADRPGTAHLLGALRAPRPEPPGPAPERDDLTMPYQLARDPQPDADATDVIPANRVATGATAVSQPGADAPEGERATRVLPSVPTGPAGPPAPSVLAPSREPYVTPPPPTKQPGQPGRPVQPRPEPPAPEQAAGRTPPPLVRGTLTLALLALTVTGFALAPYRAGTVLAVAVLVVRTVSRAGDVVRNRRYARGGSRWYDVPLAVAGSPLHLLGAVPGTLVLLVWAGGLATLTALGYLVFRLPVVPGLLLTGTVLSLSLWWGPGSGRLRRPTRRLLAVTARDPATGWLVAGGLGLLAAGCAYLLATSGVRWDPAPGAPWRSGTLLGDLLRFL